MTTREITKRHGDVRAAPSTTTLTMGLVAVGMMTAAMATMPAAAQEEQLPPGIVVDVTPQSWLNPPNVPVEGSLPGSTHRQVIIDTHIARDSAFVARPDSFGESVLPRARGPNLNLRTID